MTERQAWGTLVAAIAASTLSGCALWRRAPPPPAGELALAVSQARKDDVNRLLRAGADTHERDGYGCTVLTRAATDGATELIELLLRHGADVNDGGKCWPPVTAAAFERHTSAVGMLVAHHANPQGSGDCFSPLYFSAKEGQSEALEILLAAGAAVEGVPACPGEPLRAAAQDGQTDAVRVLLDHGANIEIKSNFSPLGAAVSGGHYDTARLLLDRGANVDAEGVEWYAPLIVAARNGRLDLVRLLLEHGADVRVRRAPIAAERGSLTAQEMTALHAAVQHGDRDVAALLLSHHAPVDAVDGDGNTPLIIAARSGRADLVALLLDNGADVRLRPSASHPTLLAGPEMTALHAAVRKGHADVVELLLRHHAPLGALDSNGATSLDLARRLGPAQVVELLESAAAQRCSDATSGEAQSPGCPAKENE